MAEFAALFADTAGEVERPAPTRLRLALRPSPAVAARTAELAAAETGCCSFFTFTLRMTGGSVSLEVTVPDAYAATLDAIEATAISTTSKGGTTPSLLSRGGASVALTSPR